jgi:hypothetical protein
VLKRLWYGIFHIFIHRSDFLGDSEDEEEESGSDDESDGSDAEFNSEFRKYKANYYIEKMDYKNVTTYVTCITL